MQRLQTPVTRTCGAICLGHGAILSNFLFVLDGTSKTTYKSGVADCDGLRCSCRGWGRSFPADYFFGPGSLSSDQRRHVVNVADTHTNSGLRITYVIVSKNQWRPLISGCPEPALFRLGKDWAGQETCTCQPRLAMPRLAQWRHMTCQMQPLSRPIPDQTLCELSHDQNVYM